MKLVIKSIIVLTMSLSSSLIYAEDYKPSMIAKGACKAIEEGKKDLMITLWERTKKSSGSNYTCDDVKKATDDDETNNPKCTHCDGKSTSKTSDDSDNKKDGKVNTDVSSMNFVEKIIHFITAPFRALSNFMNRFSGGSDKDETESSAEGVASTSGTSPASSGNTTLVAAGADVEKQTTVAAEEAVETTVSEEFTLNKDGSVTLVVTEMPANNVMRMTKESDEPIEIKINNKNIKFQLTMDSVSDYLSERNLIDKNTLDFKHEGPTTKVGGNIPILDAALFFEESIAHAVAVELKDCGSDDFSFIAVDVDNKMYMLLCQTEVNEDIDLNDELALELGKGLKGFLKEVEVEDGSLSLAMPVFKITD